MWKDSDRTDNSNFWALYTEAMTSSMPGYTVATVIRDAVASMTLAVRLPDFDTSRYDADWLSMDTRYRIRQDIVDLTMLEANAFYEVGSKTGLGYRLYHEALEVHYLQDDTRQ